MVQVRTNSMAEKKRGFVLGTWSDKLASSAVHTYCVYPVPVRLPDVKAEMSEKFLCENRSDSRDLWARRTLVTGAFGSLLQSHQTYR